jgi:superfamily II DNA or RNA helicase
MIEVRVGNSDCLIVNLSIKQHKALSNRLSYTINEQAQFFSGNYFNNKISLLSKKGVFPTGLLYIVYDYLKEFNLQFKAYDTRVKPVKQNLQIKANLTFSPYKEQHDAAIAAKTATRGIISVPTGVGKTLIAALIVDTMKLKTLIVVPSLELKRQLTRCFSEYFDPKLVGGLGSTIAIENVDALDPKEKIDYDCVILDEFHHSGAKTYRKLNKVAWANVYYKFGLTATPFRTQDNERLLLESVLSKVIYRVTYIQAVTSGYIMPVTAYYIEVPKKAQVEGYNWHSVYSELVVNNDIRNALIIEVLNILNKAGHSTLCLVKEIAHGQQLANSTGIPFAKGENDNNEGLIAQFNSKASSCLIGTTGVIGEGVDTKPTEYVIIAGLGKSRGQFMQQVGRGVRRHGDKEACHIIIFKDKSHKYTINHFNTQVKILKEEYNTIPVKLDIKIS